MAAPPHYGAPTIHHQHVTAPQAPRRPTVHEAHGVRREDNYAWTRWRRGARLYFTETCGRLFGVDPGGGGERLLFDSRQVAPGAAYLDLGMLEPSPDGQVLAYAVDVTGDEAFDLQFRDIATGTE